MCIAIIQKSKNPEYSFFVAINREEKYSKKWLDIDAHWKDYPHCKGYLDVDSGGTWLAYNQHVLAILINKEYDNDRALKTRAFVVLEALKQSKNIEDAKANLDIMDFSKTKPFNLLLVDKKSVCFGTNSINQVLQKKVIFQETTDDLIILNRTFPNDFEQIRVKNAYHTFQKIQQPNPTLNQWEDWQNELVKPCWTTNHETEYNLWLKSDEWGTLSSDIISITPNTPTQFLVHSVSKTKANEY